MLVSEVLAKAADLIEPEGSWQKGIYGKPGTGCYCAVGAIRAALGENSAIVTENWVDDNALKFLEMSSVIRLENWNDSMGRTQAEVVAKLREAAALAKEQGK